MSYFHDMYPEPKIVFNAQGKPLVRRWTASESPCLSPWMSMEQINSHINRAIAQHSKMREKDVPYKLPEEDQIIEFIKVLQKLKQMILEREPQAAINYPSTIMLTPEERALIAKYEISP